MKTKDTYNQERRGVGALRRQVVAHRPSLAAACLMSMILCFSGRLAIAGSESAQADANAPTSAVPGTPYGEPNDANTPQIPPQSTDQEPNQPPKPTIDEPNDANTPQMPPQSTDQEPNQPPKPTIDDATMAPAMPKLTTKSTRRDWLIAGTPKTDLARKIWRERITVPESSGSSDRKKQLQQLIDRIRSIKFKPKGPALQPIIVLEQTPPVEPNVTTIEPTDQNRPEAQAKYAASPKHQAPTVSDDTLNIIIRQLKQPELLKNPFELGEILFNAGRLREAAMCYRHALTRIDPNQPDPTQRRPWIIFQIGNSLRKNEPTKATEAYSQLITEHGGSLWADPAKAQISLIAWRQKDKPKFLIEQNRPKPVETDMQLERILKKEAESLTEQKKGEQTQNK